MKLSVKGLRLVRGGVSVAALPALDPCCVEVPRAPWGLMVLSVWREGGREGGSLNSLGVKILCPRVGLALIFMILIYTAPTVGANASCIAMYIVHIQGCK